MTTSRTDPVPARTTLLRPRDAAVLLAISPRKLWSLTACGDVPSIHIGRAVRYDLNDLLAWIAKQKESKPSRGSA